jgi:hypothetical protein
MRVGRSAPSSACGALLGVMSEIKSGGIGLKMDPTDVEYSLCKQEIIGSLPYGQVWRGRSRVWGRGLRIRIPRMCLSLSLALSLSISIYLSLIPNLFLSLSALSMSQASS